jgi:hypothetical protein
MSNKIFRTVNLPGKKLNESLGANTDGEDAVRHALYHRIQVQHLDLISTHGLEAVMNAVDDVAKSHSDVEELGSSDISIMMGQVQDHLGESVGITESDNSGTDPEMPDADAITNLIMGEIMQYNPDYVETRGEDTVRAAAQKVADEHADEPLGNIGTLIRQTMNYAGRSQRSAVSESAAEKRLRKMYENALAECGAMVGEVGEQSASSQVSYSRTETTGSAQVTVSATASSDAELDEILRLAGMERTPVIDTDSEEIVVVSPELADDTEFTSTDTQYPYTRW